MQRMDILSNSNVSNNFKTEKNKLKEKEVEFYDLLENKLMVEDKDKVELVLLDEKSKSELEDEDLDENIIHNEFRNIELIDINNQIINIQDINLNHNSKEVNEILETIKKLISNLNNDNMSMIEKENIIKELNFSMEKLNIIKLDIELKNLINKDELHILKDEKIKEITMLIDNLNLKINKNEKLDIKINNESKSIEELDIDLKALNQKPAIEKNNLNQSELVEKNQNYNLQLDITSQNKIQDEVISKSHDTNKDNIVLENDINLLKNSIETNKIQIKTQDSNTLNKFNVLEQIKDNVKIIDHGEFKTAVINLKPESLGSININIDLNEGKFTGKIIVENIDIKTLLENNLNELKDTLASKGVNIENFTVSVGKESLSDSKNRNFFNHYKTSKNIDLEELDEEAFTLLNFNNYGSEQIIKGSLDFKA